MRDFRVFSDKQKYLNMHIEKNSSIRMKSFLGTLKSKNEVYERDNYWKLIGEKGKVIDDVENHNPIKNSLWMRKIDLEVEME